MATISSNLQMTLPESFDKVDVDILSDNFQKIDDAYGETITKEKLANNLITTEEGKALDGRIFGLDIQLGFDVIMQGIAVFIMFALLSYILFEPVRKILEDRKNRIADEIDQAEADQAEAAKLKAEYDHKLKNVEKEADALMAQARKRALKREEEIVAGAKEEAARIIESANHEAELVKINAQDQMKQEMVKMAVLMAGKFIQNQMDEKDQNAFVDQTLQEMGDKTWLQE